jgi:hypothetical protein
MRLWRRRAELLARLDQLDQRVADVEDGTDDSLAADLLDDLAHQVAELALAAPTHDDLLELRLHTARVATDLARLAEQLQAGIDRLARGTGEDLRAVHARLDELDDAVTDLADEHDLRPRSVANHT